MRNHFYSGLFLISLGTAFLTASCSTGWLVSSTDYTDKTSRNDIEGREISKILIKTSSKWIGPDQFLVMVRSKEGALFKEKVLEEDVERIHKSGYAKEITATSQLISGKVEVNIKIVVM